MTHFESDQPRPNLDELVVSPVTEEQRLQRIAESGYTTKDFHYLLDSGLDKLPDVESGTKIKKGEKGSGEAENKAYRIEYIRTNLGIDPEAILDPISSADNPEFLKPRLVSDHTMDLVTLAKTMNTNPHLNPQPFVDGLNALTSFRYLKARLAKEIDPTTGKSYRKLGLENNFSAGRSEDMMHPSNITQF